MIGRTIGSSIDPERIRRHKQLRALRERLREVGATWADVRDWALGETAAGRRAWKPADVPIQGMNATVVEAYLDHLDSTAGEP